MKPSINKYFFVTSILALAGFLDAFYLGIKKVMGASYDCFLFTGCDAVANSKYATLFNVPLAMYGAGFYLMLLVLSILVIDKKNELASRIVAYLSFIGLLVTLVLLFLQAFVIKQYCSYCLLSAIFCTGIFISMMFFLYQAKLSNKKTAL